MQKIILSVLIFNFSMAIYSQTLEISGGYVINRFHDFGYENPFFRESKINKALF